MVGDGIHGIGSVMESFLFSKGSNMHVKRVAHGITSCQQRTFEIIFRQTKWTNRHHCA